ncbi:MAG: Coenzyme F420 hydrogenase/dehydrogenase, beta subunit C-terminal domain [Candidatus Krumholzibacteriota bacterium]|nr:Coenzyme F420 hydrogenase/dehydrogenase, beta subunit C-terminal domain [Candidatus Krumholzibacteriota bacterium]
MNVIDAVVDRKLCVGCGMCAAICPRNRLEMYWNEQGAYNPTELAYASDCPASCSICYDTCPAHSRTKNETEIGRHLYSDIKGIKYKEQTGYYLSSYVGYSDDADHRKNGASGGVATLLLETLLKTGAVDSVIAVGPTADPEKLFEFRICKLPEDVRACSRSAYYPVEISDVIRHILEHEGRYAVIGLPCVCKAIRLAQAWVPRLRRRIHYVLGLTCGHQSSKFFAEYICALTGGNPEAMKKIVFRIKDPNKPASNFGIAIYTISNEKENRVFWNDGVSDIYNSGYFQLPGCFCCDDVFAECADATIMDAWLLEYIRDPEGNSLIIARRPELAELCVNTSHIKPIGIERIIESQKSRIRNKRTKLFGRDTPQMRDLGGRGFIIDRLMKFEKLRIAFKSAQLWDRNLGSFQRAMSLYKWRLEFLILARSIILVPFRIARSVILRLHTSAKR